MTPLAQIRARFEAASPGPYYWKNNEMYSAVPGEFADKSWGSPHESLIETDSAIYPPWDRDTRKPYEGKSEYPYNDRTFLANSWADIRFLLHYIDVMRMQDEGT